MPSGDGSFLGLAKQTAKGTPNSTDAAFKYFLFNEGGLGANNVILPLDDEVGGGALTRGVAKTGIFSGGGLGAFIPRPDSLGLLLLAAMGSVTTTGDGVATPYTHVFKMKTDQFDVPYLTGRFAPANLWGEQFQDLRLNQLSLAFKAADFLRGQAGFIGGLPSKVATATWDAAAKVDGGPQFIAPITVIEIPTGTPASVISGVFAIGNNIPLDEQWVVGSYSPKGFDITRRAFALSLNILVEDAALYSKMMYDPAGGSTWVADVMREGDIKLDLVSDQKALLTNPYKLTIAANGQTGGAGNVIWTAQPIGVRAGRQVVMNVTGTFLADSALEPVTVTLVNDTATY